MPDITINSAGAAEFADLLSCLRDWIDLEQDQLDPLLTKHGYDLNGMRVGLDQITALLTRHDDEPVF